MFDAGKASLLAATESYATWWQDAGFTVPCSDEVAQWFNQPTDDATDFDAYVRTLESTNEAKADRPSNSAPAERAALTIADLPPLPQSLGELTDFYALLSAKTNRRCLAPQGMGAERLCLITDRPTPQDMKAGAYFSGEDGVLLDNMLRAIGLSRADVFITAAFPFAQSAEPPKEVQAYLTALLRRQLSLLTARHTLIIGDAGSRLLLGETAIKMRGRLHEINHDKGQSSLSTSFHPQGLLNRPEFKRMAWQDLQLVAKAIGPL